MGSTPTNGVGQDSKPTGSATSARLEEVQRMAESVQSVREVIRDTHTRLIDTIPNSPEHLDLVFQLRSLWTDYTALTTQYLHLTSV